MKQINTVKSTRSTRNIFFVAFAIISICPTSHAQVQRDDDRNRKEQRDEHRDDIREFRFKLRSEFASLPRVALKETSIQFDVEARKTAEEGLDAFARNNLEEAEARLLASLSLRENDFVRMKYALTLVEEKKYLEALPSCVEAALVDHEHYDSQYVEVHEHPLPLPTLAYALSQIGDLKQGAIVYNFTRMKLEKDIKRNISMFPPNKKSDPMTISEKLRLLLPPLELDIENTYRKTLIENCSILFFIVSDMNYREEYFQQTVMKQHRCYDSILPIRLATRMMEDAYKANLDSAILNFYKGYLELNNSGITLEEGIDSIKKEQPWYLSAIKIAGASSKIGAISKEYYDASEMRRISFKKRIKDRNDNP